MEESLAYARALARDFDMIPASDYPAIRAFLALPESDQRRIIADLGVSEDEAHYGNNITAWVFEVWGGTMDATDIARFMRGQIRGEAETVYLDGMEEGGIAGASSEDLDELDREQISGWIADQLQYVRAFSNDVLAARDDPAAQSRIRDRIEQWAASFAWLGALGRASAMRDMAGTWVLGAAEKHCKDCARLDGKRHRLSWFTKRGYAPQTPGSATECGGWQCQCSIVDDNGVQILP